MPLIRRAAPGQLLPAPAAPKKPAKPPRPFTLEKARPGEEEAVAEPIFKAMEFAFLLIFGAFLIATIGLVVFMLAIPLLQGRG